MCEFDPISSEIFKWLKFKSRQNYLTSLSFLSTNCYLLGMWHTWTLQVTQHSYRFPIFSSHLRQNMIIYYLQSISYFLKWAQSILLPSIIIFFYQDTAIQFLNIYLFVREIFYIILVFHKSTNDLCCSTYSLLIA